MFGNFKMKLFLSENEIMLVHGLNLLLLLLLFASITISSPSFGGPGAETIKVPGGGGAGGPTGLFVGLGGLGGPVGLGRGVVGLPGHLSQ
jgi:hypothetical protein